MILILKNTFIRYLLLILMLTEVLRDLTQKTTVFSKNTAFLKTRLFQNHGFFKNTAFSKSRLFQNHGFFKNTAFSKSRLFQNHGFFKITAFSKTRLFQKHGFFKNTAFSKIRIKNGSLTDQKSCLLIGH